jgi:hypothetical protein
MAVVPNGLHKKVDVCHGCEFTVVPSPGE